MLIKPQTTNFAKIRVMGIGGGGNFFVSQTAILQDGVALSRSAVDPNGFPLGLNLSTQIAKIVARFLNSVHKVLIGSQNKQSLDHFLIQN